MGVSDRIWESEIQKETYVRYFEKEFRKYIVCYMYYCSISTFVIAKLIF